MSRIVRRFGALSPDEGLASSTYRVWRHKAGDLYVANRHRGAADAIKISCHASGLWKVEDYVNDRRTTWEPTAAVLEHGEPFVRILIPGSGLLHPPPDDPDSDGSSWATFRQDTKAIEFRLHLVEGETEFVKPPGVTVDPMTLGSYRGRHVVLTIRWHYEAPIDELFTIDPRMDPEGFQAAVDRVRSEEAVASMWLVSGGTCFILDRIMPVT